MKRLFVLIILLFASTVFAATGDITFIGPGLQTVPLPTVNTLGGVKVKPFAANNFLTSLGTDGKFTSARPVPSDILGLDTYSLNADNITSGTLSDLLFNGRHTVEDTGTLAQAVAAIGSTDTTLLYSTDQTLTADLVVPSNIQLVPLDGAVIIPGGYSFTYAGPTKLWPLVQVISGAGTVVLSGADVLYTEWFGAKADNSTLSGSAIARTISVAAGRQVILQYGTYLCDTSLERDVVDLGYAPGLKIKGQGKYNTIIDNRSGGVLITATKTGGDVLDYQEDVRLEDFSITNATSGTSSGIKISSVRFGLLKNLKIVDQSSHAVEISSTVNDVTDNVHITVEDCDIEDNGGQGVYATGGASAVNALVVVRNNRIVGNAGGGIGFYTMQNGIIEYNSIAANTLGVEISMESAGSYSKNVEVRNNEFDTNADPQLLFGSAENCSAHNNYFVVNTGGGTVTENINVSALALNITLKDNMPRTAVGYTGLTMYNILAGASNIKIEDTDWSAWVASGNTKYSDSGTGTIILDSNKYIRMPESTTVSISPMTDNYAPPNKSGNIHRIIINTTDAMNLAAPEYAGGEITLLVWNTSGGALNLVFDAIYSQPTFTAPASTKQKTAVFFYDSASAKWKIKGQWSGDF